METFLDKLAEDLLQRFGTFESVAVVFPTRRAGLFFRDALSRKLPSPAWSPVTYSIQDFIRTHASVTVPDTLSLQVELFQISSQYFPGESFAAFLPWSEVLLRDFDEADRYMVDAQQFFRNIRDLNELSEAFGLSQEDEERIRDFWKSYYGTERTSLKDEFGSAWSVLHKLYVEFRHHLESKGWAYEGLAYRNLCEALETGSKTIPYKTVVFAGMYALSQAEERIIVHLAKKGQAIHFWDTDAYYTDDKRQEAGHFIRTSKLATGDYKWKFNFFATQQRDIVSVGVPLQVGQARSAGEVIDGMLRNGVDARDIAVVLADERLLFPMLYSLPATAAAVNVTMGFPLKEAPVFTFLEALIRMQEERRSGTAGDSFLFRHVAALLTHPVMRSAEAKWCNRILDTARERRWIRIPVGEIVSGDAPGVARIIFAPVSPAGLLEWLLQILDALVVSDRQEGSQPVESEFLFRFYTLMRRLQDLLPRLGEELTYASTWQLLSGLAAQQTVPFSGEPLQGLQIMGMLESRLLDFRHVVVLSANEDVLPPSSTHISFVPYGIRKAFGLPGKEENHAVTAYHFFRLLQRATSAHLFYNTEAGGLATGEKSRFISQIGLELARKYPGIVRFEEKIMLPPVPAPVVSPLIVQKTPAVLEALGKYHAGERNPGQYVPKISPTALSNYMQCSMRFYLSNVAGLREAEDPEDSMDARLFGEVLHAAMQSLYTEGKTYAAADAVNLKQRAEEAVDDAIREKYRTEAGGLEGKDILARNVLTRLVSGILDLDSRDAPFTIRYLEKTFIHPMQLPSGRLLHVGGVVDRIDERNGLARVLDYKTGNVNSAKASSIDALFSDPKYKEQFQAWFYAWLYSRMSGQEKMLSGLVIVRQLNEGIRYIHDGEPVGRVELEEFEQHLVALMESIYDPVLPFIQTEDKERCRYCAFREICNR